MRDMRNQYPFRGDEEIDLNEAMGLMDHMQDMDELERQLERTQYGGDIDDIDEEKLRELLGDEAAETLDQLKKFLEVLEEAGYIRTQGQQLRADAARHAQDRPEGARRDLLAAQEGSASASTQVARQRPRRRARRRHQDVRVRRPVPPRTSTRRS